jgi:hypothetical protein
MEIGIDQCRWPADRCAELAVDLGSGFHRNSGGKIAKQSLRDDVKGRFSNG